MLNKGAAGSLCTGRAWGPAMPSLSSLDVWTALHSSMIQHSFPACSSEAPAPTSGGPYQRAHVSRWQPQLGGEITFSVTCQHQSDEFQYWGCDLSAHTALRSLQRALQTFTFSHFTHEAVGSHQVPKWERNRAQPPSPAPTSGLKQPNWAFEPLHLTVMLW